MAPLRLVSDAQQELLQLQAEVEAFHDTYGPELPYAMVAVLQDMAGTEHLERCLLCYMPKYLVTDGVCNTCRKTR